nr:helix-turn-helix transcriptional regulator [Sporolactobacillus sp. STSJ-5]
MNKIARLIEQKGLKKTFVAQQVGISKGSLSNIVSGKTKEPSLHVAIKLAKVLGTTVEDLWGNND